jgi:hypothetical protein
MLHLRTKRKLHFIDNQLDKLINLFTNYLIVKNNVGRPTKINSVKSGELRKGECRFTFITTDEIANSIRKGAKEEQLTIKEYLNKIFNNYWEWNKPKNKNKNKLKVYLENKINKIT